MVKVFRPSRYKVPVKKLTAFTQSSLEKVGMGDFLVNIVFVGKRKMIDIATEYKNEEVALPILTFTYKEESADTSEQPLLGEMYICYPQAVLLAAEKEKTVNGMMESLINHGISNLMKSN